MPFNLLAASDDTTISTSAVVFGADATNSASPSKFTLTAVFNLLKTLDNTWSGQQTNALGTITTSKPFAITQTWAAAVTFTGFSIDITNTSSNSNSIIASFGSGGVSQFRIMRNYQILAGQGGSFWNFAVASLSSSANIGQNCVALGPNTVFGWNSSDASSYSPDTALWRDAGGIVGVRGGSLTTPGGLSFYTYAASPPSAPSASMARVYADTSGGKIRLMALFPSGAAQQIAIEP